MTIHDGFGEGGPGSTEPILLAPPPLVPPEDVAQGSVGVTAVAEETCSPVKQARAEARRGKSAASIRAFGCKPDFHEKKVASSRPHAAT